AALVPVARGKDSPHAQMAALALQKNDRARAVAELQALVAVDFDNVEAARQLASLLQQAGVEDPAKVGAVNQRIAAIDPFAAAALALTLVPALQPRVDAQLPNAPDDRYAGLQWRFVRVKYHYVTEGTRFQQQEYYGEPWYIDAPAAEQNLSRRVKTATAIQ